MVKKKTTAVELTEQGKIKQMYALRINNFSARSLQYIFIKHLDRTAKLITNKWKDYRPIVKTYITQIEINKVMNFKVLHINDTSSKAVDKSYLFVGK